jgi:hypothetical protein
MERIVAFNGATRVSTASSDTNRLGKLCVPGRGRGLHGRPGPEGPGCPGRPGRHRQGPVGSGRGRPERPSRPVSDRVAASTALYVDSLQLTDYSELRLAVKQALVAIDELDAMTDKLDNATSNGVTLCEENGAGPDNANNVHNYSNSAINVVKVVEVCNTIDAIRECQQKTIDQASRAIEVVQHIDAVANNLNNVAAICDDDACKNTDLRQATNDISVAVRADLHDVIGRVTNAVRKSDQVRAEVDASNVFDTLTGHTGHSGHSGHSGHTGHAAAVVDIYDLPDAFDVFDANDVIDATNHACAHAYKPLCR